MNLFWLNHSVRPRKLTLLEAQKLLEQKIAQRLHPDNLVVSPQFPYDDLFTKGKLLKKVHFFLLLFPTLGKWQLLSAKVHLSPVWHMDHLSMSLQSNFNSRKRRLFWVFRMSLLFFFYFVIQSSLILLKILSLTENQKLWTHVYLNFQKSYPSSCCSSLEQ